MRVEIEGFGAVLMAIALCMGAIRLAYDIGLYLWSLFR